MRRKGDAVAWLTFFATRGAAAAIALLILSRHGGTVSPSPWSGYADAIRDGHRPYRDFDVLYPPGLLLLSALGSLLPASAFHAAVVLMVFASEVVTFAFLGRVSAGGQPFTPARAYVLIAVLSPLQLVVPYAVGTFYDPLPAGALFFSLYLLREEGARSEMFSLVLLALAILLKTFPIVVAPFILIYIGRRHDSWWASLRAGAVLAGLVVVPVLASCLLDARGVIESYGYLAKRAVEWESTPGLIAYLLGGRTHWLWPDAAAFSRGLPTFGWGFVAIRGPGEAWIRRSLSGVFVIGMAGAAGLACRGRLGWSDLVRFALASVLLLLGTAPVFSPLYITWLFPLLALTQTDAEPPTRWIFVVGAATSALTSLPSLLGLGIGPASVALLTARTVALFALLGLLGQLLRRSRDLPGPPDPRPSCGRETLSVTSTSAT
jgi:hypothetical protein